MKSLSSFKTSMTPTKYSIIVALAILCASCKKDNQNEQVIAIPNGDFELWDNMPNLLIWQTNSCPVCVPAYDTYIIKKVTDASRGQFAAKFIYNSVYSSFAANKFAISIHPSHLAAYIKSTIATGDTALIHVDLFSGNNVVDSGNFYETLSNTKYRRVDIPISQSSLVADSALIKIVGGKKHNTELYVDNLTLLKITK